jgi:TRAP-type C4-dicarboxylate transport system substrate-binding protein
MKLATRWIAALLLAAVAGIAHAQTKTIKIATAAPEGTVWLREMRAGADAVKARTADRVQLKYYPGAVMGNDAAVLRKIKLGQLQGGAFTGAELSSVYPDSPIYSLPFLFRSQEEVDFVRGKLDARLKKGFVDNGMVIAGMSGGGFAYLLSTKPIRNRDDLKATKVWSPEADTIAQVALKAGGVQPITLPLSDVYTALQTGLVETVANTPSGSIAFQWHTKLKFMVDLPLTYVMGLLAIDKKAMDGLSAEDQLAVTEEMQKVFDRIDAQNRKDNEAARATLEKQGVKMEKPSADEVKFWQQVGDDATKQLANEKTFSAEMLGAVQAALKEFRAKGGKP